MTKQDILHDVHDLIKSVIAGNEKLVNAYFDNHDNLIVVTEDKENNYEWEFNPSDE